MSERLKINIYDQANHKRLLGYVFADRLDRRAGPGRTPTGTMQWACVTRDGPWYADPRRKIPEGSFCTVTLHVADDIDAPPNTYGWVRQSCLVTSSPLEDLLKMEHFHLPGETDREHAMRHNSYRWP